MHSGPSKLAEALAAILTPPDCREEVLGDLHERYRSSTGYWLDVLSTLPLVILSRIRRTTDAQAMVMQAAAVYTSFLVPAWLFQPSLAREAWGLVFLTIPVAAALLGIALDDVYSISENGQTPSLLRGPLFGMTMALWSQIVLRTNVLDVAISPRVTVYGCALGLLLSCAARLLFPPIAQSRRARARALRSTSPKIAGPQEDPNMSKLKIAVLCLVLICAAGAVWLTTQSQQDVPNSTYSEFLHEVRSGHVTNVVLVGNAVKATYRLKDGKTVETTLPSDYKDALTTLQEKQVNIEIRDSSSDPRRLAVNAVPFFLLLGFWLLLLIFKSPILSGPKGAR